MNINRSNRFVPLIIAISVIVGMFIGTIFANRFAGNKLSIINSSQSKLNDLLHIIDDMYVDTINLGEIVEGAIPKILTELDPHSSYIPAKDAQTADDDLRGSFSGIGVQFTIRQDTIRVNNVIKGGPSEKIGILAGDKIIAIDGKPFVGKEVTNEETFRRLRGEKGTKVKLGIQRHGHTKPLTFTVVRGDIPVSSIDATYKPVDGLGYIRINKFGETTYGEMLASLAELEESGSLNGLIIDLRDNGGGYLSTAIQIVNEFLPKDKLIVYTEGRRSKREEFRSNGTGAYKDLPLIILTNESSASASEIFAGAIQDNDRGVIIGRRTFGKGLVQQPLEFSDGSCIRLTIARYYTPSGRCIQKPFVKGDLEDYEMDIVSRYQRGEFFSQDSIRQTGKAFKTSIGRTVYDGGGIMPDYFVGEDTTALSTYYTECVTQGTIAQFCYDYTDNHRSELVKLGNAMSIEKNLRQNAVLDQFIRYADNHGISRRNNQIITSQKLLEKSIYGTIIYNALDMSDYLQYLNREDNTMLKAIEIYKTKKTVPTAPKSKKLNDQSTKRSKG